LHSTYLLCDSVGGDKDRLGMAGHRALRGIEQQLDPSQPDLPGGGSSVEGVSATQVLMGLQGQPALVQGARKATQPRKTPCWWAVIKDQAKNMRRAEEHGSSLTLKTKTETEGLRKLGC